MKYPVELDENMKPVRALHPLSMSLDWRMTPLTTAALVLCGDPPSVGTWIRLTMPDGDGAIFRVQRVVRKTDGLCSVTLAHGLISLQDSMVLDTIAAAGTIRSTLSALLGSQTCWQAGSMADEGSYSFTFSGENLLSAVLRLTEPLEGDRMWSFQQNSLPWTLSMVQPSGTCELRLRRALTDAEITVDRTDLCTCLMPVGPDGMTIESVNDGSRVLVSANEAVYGRVTRIFHDSTASDPGALKKNAQRELSKRDAPVVQVKANALDLFRLSREELDRLRPGAMCRVPVKSLKMELEERIVRLAYADLVGNPEQVQVTLANMPLDTARAINGKERVR